ncbi:MAG: DUF3102 domain-containing protein [Tepidisphaeraceae bacterium]
MTTNLSQTTDAGNGDALADLARRFRDEHEACEAAGKKAIDHAIAAGALLIEAKANIPHGGWLPWLTDNCNVSERTAQTYMRIARNRAELPKAQRAADLSLRDAVALLAEPKDDPKDRDEPADGSIEDDPADGPLADPAKVHRFEGVRDALVDIRDQRLYRSTHPDFESYCRDQWGLSADYFNGLLEAGTWPDAPPPDAAVLLLHESGEFAIIAASVHHGFYHVARTEHDLSDGVSVVGTKKPVRAHALGLFVPAKFRACTAEIITDELMAPLPWLFNHLLFGSEQQYVDRVILGKSEVSA